MAQIAIYLLRFWIPHKRAQRFLIFTLKPNSVIHTCFEHILGFSEAHEELENIRKLRDEQNELENKCKMVIEQIRQDEFGIGIDLGEKETRLVKIQREREGRSLHRLSTELYSKDTHFVLELVQNADDNSYPQGEEGRTPSLKFIVANDKVFFEKRLTLIRGSVCIN